MTRGIKLTVAESGERGLRAAELRLSRAKPGSRAEVFARADIERWAANLEMLRKGRGEGEVRQTMRLCRRIHEVEELLLSEQRRSKTRWPDVGAILDAFDAR